jgi:hypothetical protein
MKVKTIVNRLAVFVAVAGIAVTALAVAASAGEQDAATLSERLSGETALVFDDQRGYVVGEQLIRARAGELAGEVPLPPGGSFVDIHWENLGAATDAQIETLLQANASCDWYRYALAHPEDGEARTIVAEIPRWSGIRGLDLRIPAVRIADDVAAGGREGLRAMVEGACSGRPAGFPLPAELRAPQDG